MAFKRGTTHFYELRGCGAAGPQNLPRLGIKPKTPNVIFGLNLSVTGPIAGINRWPNTVSEDEYDTPSNRHY